MTKKRIVKANYNPTHIEQGARLRGIRTHLRYSRLQLQEKLGISARTLQNWESGRSAISEEGLRDIVTFAQTNGINCTPEWVRYGVGEHPIRSMTGSIASDSRLAVPLSDQQLMQEELRLYYSHYPASMDLIVPDSSLWPFYRPQDLVAGPQVMGDDIDKLVGEICIVKTLNKGALLRRLQAGSDGYRYNLYITHPEDCLTEQTSEVYSAARIIWVRRQVSL